VIALAVSISSLCQPSRRAVWALFWLGLSAILLHEGLERFSAWIFANARVGYSFELWLAAGMSSWRWHVVLGIVLNPLKALVMTPLLAWVLRRDAALAAEEKPLCDCVPGHLCELHADEEKNEPETFCPACDAGVGQCNGPHKGNAGEVPY